MQNFIYKLLGSVITAAVLANMAFSDTPAAPRITRLGNGPIIVPHMDERMGSNIQGP
jgi:hypothetical protein